MLFSLGFSHGGTWFAYSVVWGASCRVVQIQKTKKLASTQDPILEPPRNIILCYKVALL